MIYESERGDLRMAAVGDILLSRRLTPFEEPDYLKLVDIVRSADVGFFNLETTVHAPHEGNPASHEGTVMTTPPELLDDIKWMGFNLTSTANNHANDYGPGGVLACIEHLRRARLAYAGTGATMGLARAPGYLDTRMGRVGLVACTSFYHHGDRAADSRPDSAGRAGVNPLAFSHTYTLDAESLAVLRRIKEGIGLSRQQDRRLHGFMSAAEAGTDDQDSVTFMGSRFRRGDGYAASTRASPKDAEAILRQVREARRQADWVVLSLHNHEVIENPALPGYDPDHLDDPATFARDFAHAAIDAGADIVVGQGPHVPLGIEIYKGKPILYCLGNFVMQNDTVESFPADSYGRFDLGTEATPADFLDARTGNDTRGFPATEGNWHALLAECEWKDRKLSSLLIHPCDLGFGRKRSERGRPVLARGAVAQSILSRIKTLSERLGTDFAIEGETGVVRLG